MADASLYKLSLLARRQHLPVLPGQQEGTTYGVIWGGCPIPENGSCYIVKFEGSSNVSILAYMDDRGGVFHVDQPITVPPDVAPDLAVVPDDDGIAGTVYVKSDESALQPLSRYRGSFRGTMREVHDPETWNTTRSLTYRSFIASMYLRYCVLEPKHAQAPDEVPVDMTMYELAHPVELFDDFVHLSFPDALDALAYRTASAERASGIERFAHRMLSELDRSRIRRLSETCAPALAFIDRMDGFYLNFDRSTLSPDDVACMLAAETAVNRLYRVASAMGFSHKPVTASLAEESCSACDQASFAAVTSWVDRLAHDVRTENPFEQLDSVLCKAGGTWDILTRVAGQCERLNTITRLEYDYRFDASAHTMRMQFVAPPATSMPASRFDVASHAWSDCSPAERADYAAEYAARIMLVLAAIAFSVSYSIERCVVEAVDLFGGMPRAVAFDRTSFMADLAPFARELDGVPLETGTARVRLARYLVGESLRDGMASLNCAPPREDTRALPPELRDLLLADTAAELEVMEPADTDAMRRFHELHERAAQDPAQAEQGLIELIESLEASCAAVELMSDVPLITRFCENHVGRVLLPVLEEDRRVRVHRAPDALFFARTELCHMYLQAGAYDRALAEARAVLDIAPTSMQAHALLVNVLAGAERYQEVIDVAKHGLRVAYDRSSIAYLFYRMAFAYWALGDRETAAACYRLVLRGERVSAMAEEESRQLLRETGRDERPTFEEAATRALRQGIAVPPGNEGVVQIANAAIRLSEQGFNYVASRCVFALWRLLSNDVLGAVHRALLP